MNKLLFKFDVYPPIRQYINYRNLFFLLCVLCVSVVNSLAQDWKTVADGVEYARIRREFSGKPVNINLLRLDLKKVRLDVHHALDRAIGTEKTSSIATRHGAFAAINAGFFRLDSSAWAGDSVGVLMIDGQLLSESANNRIALGIRNDQKRTAVVFDHTVAWAGLASDLSDVGINLDGINREPKLNETILFSSGMVTPKQADKTAELVLRKCTPKCEAELVTDSAGGTQVPDKGYVVVFGRDSDKQGLVDWFRKSNVRTINARVLFLVKPDGFRRPELMGSEDIIAGVPQLIKNGKIDITWEQEKASKSFVETRHPRTAVAKLKDGKFLMLTVDGRTEQSAGLDLYDLAKYMLELGAVDAMNLDGGGSTTMFLDGKVVNRPSDKDGERKIGDAILVTRRKKKN